MNRRCGQEMDIVAVKAVEYMRNLQKSLLLHLKERHAVLGNYRLQIRPVVLKRLKRVQPSYFNFGDQKRCKAFTN